MFSETHAKWLADPTKVREYLMPSTADGRRGERRRAEIVEILGCLIFHREMRPTWLMLTKHGDSTGRTTSS